jgi:hypothetical protein
VGLGVFLVTETDAATSALGSARAIWLVVATATAWLVLRAVSARLPNGWAVARTGAFGLAAAGVLAVVVLPAYDDTTVVERMPRSLVPAPTTTTIPSSADAVDAITPTAPTAAVPHQLADGDLHGIDHRASGLVHLFRGTDGRFVVQLEEIDIQPGPDYDLYVVPGANRRGKGDGVRLDDLRGNKGTQFYDVPAGPDLSSGDWTVLVWCQTFGVPVAAAALTPA